MNLKHPPAGTVQKGEVIIGKPKPSGKRYVLQLGVPGSRRDFYNDEDAMAYAWGLKESNEDR